jgi:predicted nucleic acid-binding protein
MNIVVDTNILLSILIKPTGVTSKLFYSLLQNNNLFIPEEAFVELLKHHQKIAKSSSLNNDEINDFKIFFFQSFTIIKDTAIPKNIVELAFGITKEIDIHDVVFVAAALQINGILWSGDKKLKDGLALQNHHLVYNNIEIEKFIV